MIEITASKEFGYTIEIVRVEREEMGEHVIRIWEDDEFVYCVTDGRGGML